MSKNPRCLYNSSLAVFAAADENSVLGILCNKYQANAQTTTIDDERLAEGKKRGFR